MARIPPGDSDDSRTASASSGRTTELRSVCGSPFTTSAEFIARSTSRLLWKLESRIIHEPLQQRRAYSTFRDTSPQLVRTNPEGARHGCGKGFVPGLDEPVIAQVATRCFAPEP